MRHLRPELRANHDPWFFYAGAPDRDSSHLIELNEAAIVDRLGKRFSTMSLDLLDLVGAVHVVDRLQRRPSSSRAGSSWSRKIHLVLGVREPSAWQQAEVLDGLIDHLRRLTDDDWTIEFVARTSGRARPAESVDFLFETPTHADVVGLFSGGLDSLAGLAIDIAEGRMPMAVSVWTNLRMQASQQEITDRLNHDLKVRISRASFRFHLSRIRAVEQTQRARGFGFLALAAVVADACNLDSVHVYENGVGAINLPYSAAQTGAHGTRAMRPETLHRAANLHSKVLGRKIAIINKSQYRTKADLCRALPVQAQSTIELTESCDFVFANRGTGSCGQCTSCILRRQSLAASNLSHLDCEHLYKFDAFDSHPNFRSELYPLHAMLNQASKLQRIGELDPSAAWRELLAAFPDIVSAAHALNLSHSREPNLELLNMLVRYANEWLSVPSELVGRYLNRPGIAS